MEGCTSHTQVQQLVLSRYFVGVWLNILIVLSVGSLSLWVYQALVEPTSGNTGMGLAMLANAKGFTLTTPLSKEIPVEKRAMLRFFGSNVEELDDDL